MATKKFKQTVTVYKGNGGKWVVELDCSWSQYPCHQRLYRTRGWALRHANELVEQGGFNLNVL